MGRMNGTSDLRGSGFDRRCRYYERFLRRVATRYACAGPFNDVDELYQLLLLALWRCVKKYDDYEDGHFHNLLLRAITNTIAGHFRLKSQKRDREKVTLDRFDDDDPEFRWRTPARTDYGSDYFPARIHELLTILRPRTATAVMDSLIPGSKKTLAPRGRLYDEVKRAIEGL